MFFQLLIRSSSLEIDIIIRTKKNDQGKSSQLRSKSHGEWDVRENVLIVSLPPLYLFYTATIH